MKEIDVILKLDLEFSIVRNLLGFKMLIEIDSVHILVHTTQNSKEKTHIVGKPT